MGLLDNITYLWEDVIIMISEHCYVFVRKTTSEARLCCNVNIEGNTVNTVHKTVVETNVVTSLVFLRATGSETNVVTISLQRYPTSQPKNYQKPTLLQHRIQAGRVDI